MHDPFPQIWRDKLAALPQVATLQLSIVPNTDREELTCLMCRRGDRPGYEPEWLVTYRGPAERITMGLHEACRMRNEER